MTIQEAMRSGRKIRRNDPPYCVRHPFGFVEPSELYNSAATLNYGTGLQFLTPDDILATDWEVEEEKIEITRSQLQKAFSKSSFPIPSLSPGFADYSCRIDILAIELGFKS
jgi:hypothetical protein